MLYGKIHYLNNGTKNFKENTTLHFMLLNTKQKPFNGTSDFSFKNKNISPNLKQELNIFLTNSD